MEIELTNGTYLTITDVNNGLNVDLFDSEGRQIEPTLFVSDGELVSLLNIARVIYANGMSVDAYLTYGNWFDDIHLTGKSLRREK